MDNASVEKFIYAFTGGTKDDFLERVIKEWEDYLAAGGDPDKYIKENK
jgi:hypothetical protein